MLMTAATELKPKPRRINPLNTNMIQSEMV